MTTQELAALLDDREIGEEMTEQEEALAKESGLVVVFGASDDLVEFRGAIDDEMDYQRSVCISIHKERKTASALRGGNKNQIFAVWCDPSSVADWSYQTSIPHSKFNVPEGNSVYCHGIVFSISDLQS